MANEFENDTSKLLLSAVNVLLQTIGEEPIEDVADMEEVLEASIAKSVIIEVKMEVLADKWDINYDAGYTLPVVQDGTIPVPYNILEVNSDDGDLIPRAWFLYSKSNQSNQFTEAQDVNIVWNVLFNDLPHAIRNYITIKASRKFQARQVMDDKVYAFTIADENDALSIARHSENRTTVNNILGSL